MCLCIRYESPVNKEIGLAVLTSLCLLLGESTLPFIVKICVFICCALTQSEGFNASKDDWTESEVWGEREKETEKGEKLWKSVIFVSMRDEKNTRTADWITSITPAKQALCTCDFFFF